MTDGVSTASDAVVDHWVREFDVSNPQKTHEGYTVYRISSKLYPKGSPEAASEVIVFKRYSEIRKLYKELKAIYDGRKESIIKEFPHFSKANFFSRFDEAVIEERQRQALLLLTFAGNIFSLFTSQAFVHFFEGGVEHRGSSVCSSASDDPTDSTQLDNVEAEPWMPQTYFDPDLNSSDEEAVEDMEDNVGSGKSSSVFLESANKTWLARAMSLCSEGDDIETLASGAGCNAVSEFKKDEEGVNSGSGREVEGKGGDERTHLSQGSVDLLPTLLESSEGEDLGEDEDVFVATPPRSESDTGGTMAVCEEQDGGCKGGDVTLGCLNDAKFLNESVCTVSGSNDIEKLGDKRRAGQEFDHSETRGGSCINHTATDKMNEEDEDFRENRNIDSNVMVGSLDDHSRSIETKGSSGMRELDESDEHEKIGRTITENSRTSDGISEMSGTDNGKDDNRTRDVVDRSEKDHIDRTRGAVEKGQDNGMESDKKDRRNEKGREQVGRKVSNIGISWIDPRKKDYLYEAAQIIQQALYSEANECYEEAFNKYKMCVGILLQGVQHDGNSKRRDAVRRKTAQYLLKAEFLYNTYLKEEQLDDNEHDLAKQSTKSSKDSFLHEVVDRRFRQLTLKSLKVIGVVRKAMLTQCEGLDGVFALKVLHKTNAVHRNAKQETNQANKGYTKKYVRSPYMVKLHQHFDTNNSVFLLLDYAGGSALWDHVYNLRQRHVVYDVTSRDAADDVGPAVLPETSDGNTITRGNEPSNVTDGENLSPLENNPTGSRPVPSHDASQFTDYVTDHVDECVQRWIAELLLAIASLHASGIILKDLKPANVLLNDDNHVMLTYFGVWEEVDHSVDLEAVERLYCAPEISCGEKITVSCDWWSLGVLSYELITGKTLSSVHPWGIHSHSSISFPTDKISAEACSFLKELICHNPSERLGSGMAGVEEIKSHAFFTGVNWQELSKRA